MSLVQLHVYDITAAHSTAIRNFNTFGREVGVGGIFHGGIEVSLSALIPSTWQLCGGLAGTKTMLYSMVSARLQHLASCAFVPLKSDRVCCSDQSTGVVVWLRAHWQRSLLLQAEAEPHVQLQRDCHTRNYALGHPGGLCTSAVATVIVEV